MSFWDLVKAKLAEPGTEPLTEAEKAALLEASRRHGAWEVFVDYHHGAMWAREDAARKQEENAYLPPEAVEYMQGEIKRRAGREALLKAMEQAEHERVEREYAKGIAGTAAGQAVQRGDQSDGSRDAADHRGTAGEGKAGAGSGGEVCPGESQATNLESDFTNGTTTCDFKLAGELHATGRGHEGQPASDAPTASQDGAANGAANGVGGENQGTQGEGI